MKFLILLHVLSAIIGVGPTFFAHVLVRKKQTAEHLRHSLKMSALLENFPKIGGSLAVITGLVLYFVGEYGAFTQVWLLGSLILYVLIQIIVIGFVTPQSNKLQEWLDAPENKDVAGELPEEAQELLNRMNSYFYFASALGITLFIFMILKP
ncbi:DUF2269 family protein [Bacillus salacetis]|uniref:DUF2269 family protein n=1 Tax=Bacillus salacetis TaxID=2315464 RepID=A0A3A1QYD8_9BACI|nr:DUF2269 family protein [Bacillus salacetis]RIW33990.1 DUF2269 family protein [Bacillus salacetis]